MARESPTPTAVQRLYTYTQHGDRMYGGADKLLRLLQYSLGCLGCLLRGPSATTRALFISRQLMILKNEIDRGRCVSRFFGLLDEVVLMRKGTRYMGKEDRSLTLLGYGSHLTLCGYYITETIWWFFGTCPEVDMALVARMGASGPQWLQRWDGPSPNFHLRFERWFNWPITLTSFFDLGLCIRRWVLLSRARQVRNSTIGLRRIPFLRAQFAFL